MFGSMLVDEKSLTPYSDATQVSSVGLFAIKLNCLIC
jgi:hypothetical protein